MSPKPFPSGEIEPKLDPSGAPICSVGEGKQLEDVSRGRACGVGWSVQLVTTGRAHLAQRQVEILKGLRSPLLYPSGDGGGELSGTGSG